MNIKVKSEIGKLKKVLVHKPGKEVERIYPELFERLLFDDIMHLEKAQEEHNFFVQKLLENKVEVFYIAELVAEVLDSSVELRNEFINQFLTQAHILNKSIATACTNYLHSIKNNLELVQATIAGITKRDIQPDFQPTFIDMVASSDDYPIYIDPIPNILFQRDPMACIYDGSLVNNMWAKTRKREAIYIQFVLDYHPLFKTTPRLSDENFTTKGTTEGGDILVLNEKTIFVGLSQRTNALGIQKLAAKLFSIYPLFQTLVAIEIPKGHATMHLDTVLTQIDHKKFSIDMDMNLLHYTYYEITRSKTNKQVGLIKDILQKYVAPDVRTFVVGGGSPLRSKREQWNDGANSLAISPGKIIVYDRNKITNELLEKEGVEIIKIPSSELSRGRGGPRCMSMPLEREEL